MNQSLLSRIDPAGMLVTYAIYSTIVLLVVTLLTRQRWSVMTTDLRCLLWKWGMLVPIPLAMLAAVVPSPVGIRQIQLADSWGDSAVASSRWPTPPGNAQGRLDPTLSERSGVANRAAGMRSTERTSGPTADASVLEMLGGRELTSGIVRSPSFWALLVAIWIGGALWGLLRFLMELQRIGRLKGRSQPIVTGPILERLRGLQRLAGLRGRVRLYVSQEIDSPMTAGTRRPFIMFPSALLRRLSEPGQQAVLAHELAHVAHRDATWNILSLVVCRVYFFQPLNLLARRQLRLESEFLADRRAAELLDDRVLLARCLADLGDWLLQHTATKRRSQPLTVGMGSFRSGLGSRVVALLEEPPSVSGGQRRQRYVVGTLLLVCPIVMLCFVPRASAQRSESNLAASNSFQQRDQTMKPIASNLGVLAALAFAPLADAQTDAPASAATNEAAASIPQELENFNGMLIGKLVSRDVERGEFTVTVDYVPRIWENSKAKQPRSAVGKTLVIDGVSGKWLDNLLLIRPGDTVEFEAQHRGGDRLTFPGEWLRKVPAFNPADHPTPPDGFRGFAGIVVGKILAKQEESGELVLQVNQIEKTFDKSGASNAASVINRPIVLVGFWGKMRPPFDQLKVGQTVRAGMLHRVRQSDHFTVAEVIEPISSSPRAATSDRDRDRETAEFPSGMRGFRGILRGVVISRDVERGELVFRADEVVRVWKQNSATDAASSRGRVFTTTGISGKFLDVLLTLKPGDRIDVEAFHNRGDHLDFVGELLQKVE